MATDGVTRVKAGDIVAEEGEWRKLAEGMRDWRRKPPFMGERWCGGVGVSMRAARDDTKGLELQVCLPVGLVVPPAVVLGWESVSVLLDCEDLGDVNWSAGWGFGAMVSDEECRRWWGARDRLIETVYILFVVL
jgi:hypothetical protein